MTISITHSDKSNNIQATQLSDAELLRYSRQVLLDEWDIDAQLNLKNSHVMVIGVGGLGCPLANTLARAGVGHITLIDDDTIEASNLQRQTLFYEADIGKPKAQAAKAALTLVNEHIKVDFLTAKFDEQLLKALNAKISNVTLLIDCSDNFATRLFLNQVSVKYSIALLSASAIATNGQIALFEPCLNSNTNMGSGCYQCVFGNLQDTQQSCATSGVLASTTAVIANLQANAALHYLGKHHNPLAGQLLLWDGKRMQQTLIAYKADKACVVCQ